MSFLLVGQHIAGAVEGIATQVTGIRSLTSVLALVDS